MRASRVVSFALVCVLLVAGCATTRQTRSTEISGFLRDYSLLREGEGDQALLVYVNGTAQWPRYDAVMIDSVGLWRIEEGDDLSREDAQRLTDFFYQALHDELSKDFRIVDRPEKGVLRVRAALTEAKGARVVGDAITSVVPQARLASTLLGAATDVQVFVGRAGAEAEVSDAVTGQRLLAAVDRRAGTKAIRGGMAKWSDVKLACEYWAARLRERLVELGVRRRADAG